MSFRFSRFSCKIHWCGQFGLGALLQKCPAHRTGEANDCAQFRTRANMSLQGHHLATRLGLFPIRVCVFVPEFASLIFESRYFELANQAPRLCYFPVVWSHMLTRGVSQVSRWFPQAFQSGFALEAMPMAPMALRAPRFASDRAKG